MPSDNLVEWVQLITRILLVVIPIVITWFIRNYVKGTKSEKDTAAIVRLADSAIDLVENLDNQGALSELPDGVSKGLHKLNVAAEWMGNELKQRHGINMTDEEAKKWISSEFQKRVGGVRQTSKLNEIAKLAVNAVQSLEQNGLLAMPADTDRLTVLTNFAADWMMAETIEKTGASIPLEEAQSWVRKAFMDEVAPVPERPDDDRPATDLLADLARQAVRTVETLRVNGVLKIKPGQAVSDVNKNVVVGQLLVNAARQGLDVSLDDISAAADMALHK